MKKLACIILTAVMLMSLAVPVLAETDSDTGEEYEIFENFNLGGSGIDARLETDNFILESSYYSENGLGGGGRGDYVLIYAKENSGLIIKRIEARVASFGNRYGGVGVTAGTKREEGGAGDNIIVHVDNINESEFAFADGSERVYFDMIKVYYEKGSSETYKNCETFGGFDFGNTGGSVKVETNNFILESSHHSEREVGGGGDGEYITIKAKKNSGLEIERIEARVSCYGSNYYKVGITAGTKREGGGVGEDTIVHIDNIDRNEFAFSGGSDWVYFDRIKVYYQNPHEHIWGEDGLCQKCGALKCDVTGEHNAVPVCSYCGKELSSGNTLGSNFSEGNISIVVGIVCAVIFGLGGFLLGRKRKPVMANGADKEDEE